MAEPQGTGAASDTRPGRRDPQPGSEDRSAAAGAYREGNPGGQNGPRSTAGQHLLTRSYSGRKMAVERVTSNAGSKTPGVDGET